MSSEQYRAYDEASDYASQRELFRLSFPEATGTPAGGDAHRLWKFTAFPASPPAYEYVAAEPGQLVGYYAALPYPYSVEGQRLRAAMVCDVMSHPERRGRGIFTRIGRYATDALAQEGLAFATGYPIRPEVIPGHLKVGWKPVAKLPVYLRVLGVRSLLPRPLAFLAPLARPFAWLAQCWSLFAPAGYSVEMLGRDAFLAAHGGDGDGDYARFLDEWLAQRRNALVKDAGFLRWRTNAPGSEYLFALLRKDARIVGAALARPTALKGVEALALLDFMVLDAHRAGSRALHLALRRAALARGKDAVACMCSPRWAAAYGFAGSAYLRSHLQFTLITKKLDERLPDAQVYDEAAWHTFWIDSDDL